MDFSQRSSTNRLTKSRLQESDRQSKVRSEALPAKLHVRARHGTPSFFFGGRYFSTERVAGASFHQGRSSSPAKAPRSRIKSPFKERMMQTSTFEIPTAQNLCRMSQILLRIRASGGDGTTTFPFPAVLLPWIKCSAKHLSLGELYTLPWCERHQPAFHTCTPPL